MDSPITNDRGRPPLPDTRKSDARLENGIGGMDVGPERRGNGDGDGNVITVDMKNGKGKERMDPVVQRVQSRSPSFELIEQTPRTFVVSASLYLFFPIVRS